jgi:hypothetical protein
MTIPQFTRHEDKDEINHVEWLRMEEEYDMTPSRARNYFLGKAWNWWTSVDMDIKWKMSWEEFEELFSNKWIKDKKRRRRCINFKS